MKAIKSAIVGVVFLLPTIAFGASVSDCRFSNNQTTIDATGNSTVSGTCILTVGPGEVVEWFRLLPAGNPFTEQSVGGTLGYQENVYTNIPFSVRVPPNTGTYNVDMQAAGIWGGNRSINGGDNVVMGPTSIGTVRVVANTPSNDGGNNTGNANEDLFWKRLETILAGIMKPATPTPPAMPAACSTLQNKMVGAVYGTHSPANVKLQGFLLSEGATIPALAAGAAFGYWGEQTQAAVNWYKGINGCN